VGLRWGGYKCGVAFGHLMNRGGGGKSDGSAGGHAGASRLGAHGHTLDTGGEDVLVGGYRRGAGRKEIELIKVWGGAEGSVEFVERARTCGRRQNTRSGVRMSFFCPALLIATPARPCHRHVSRFTPHRWRGARGTILLAVTSPPTIQPFPHLIPLSPPPFSPYT
jgi:hypothetical protein